MILEVSSNLNDSMILCFVFYITSSAGLSYINEQVFYVGYFNYLSLEKVNEK